MMCPGLGRWLLWLRMSSSENDADSTTDLKKIVNDTDSDAGPFCCEARLKEREHSQLREADALLTLLSKCCEARRVMQPLTMMASQDVADTFKLSCGRRHLFRFCTPLYFLVFLRF